MYASVGTKFAFNLCVSNFSILWRCIANLEKCQYWICLLKKPLTLVTDLISDWIFNLTNVYAAVAAGLNF